MKIRKLAAAAAIAGSAALLAPSGAGAATNGASFTLPPGNRVCVDIPAPAYFNARADGQSTRGVKFTFLVKPSGSYAYTTVNETGDGATAWAASTDRYSRPSFFPGVFRACARNNGTLSATVNLTLRTDS